LLLAGLVLGGGLLGWMVWDTMPGRKAPDEKFVESKEVVEVTTENWQTEVLESNVPVLVDFTAKWCGPCQHFAPTVHKLADRFKGKVKVAQFDVGTKGFENARRLAERYGKYEVKGIPHVMVFKGGELQTQSGTLRSEAELVSTLNHFLQ
jgi:thioredoxin 1